MSTKCLTRRFSGLNQLDNTHAHNWNLLKSKKEKTVCCTYGWTVRICAKPPDGAVLGGSQTCSICKCGRQRRRLSWHDDAASVGLYSKVLKINRGKVWLQITGHDWPFSGRLQVRPHLFTPLPWVWGRERCVLQTWGTLTKGDCTRTTPKTGRRRRAGWIDKNNGNGQR